MTGAISGFGGQQLPLNTALQKPGGIGNDDQQLRTQQANDDISNNQQVARDQNNVAAQTQENNTDFQQNLLSQDEVLGALASNENGDALQRGSLLDIEA